MKKVSSMSHDELETELKANIECLRTLTRQCQKPIKMIESETKHNLAKAEQMKKLFIGCQSKHDIFVEKLKFYESINQNCKKRKREKSESFTHSNKTRAEILDTFLQLSKVNKDKRYQIAIQILKNDHLNDTEKFKKAVRSAQANECILRSIEKRKQIHENYDQIYQLYEALFNVDLLDTDDDSEHNEMVNKLTQKLDKTRKEFMKQLNDSAVMKEVNYKITEMDKKIKDLNAKKEEILRDIEDRKKVDAEFENHMFELQMKVKEQDKQNLIESNEELRRKIEQIQQLTGTIKSQNKYSEDLLGQLREDINIINGPFKEIIESYPSDPFDDPNFVALFNGPNTPDYDLGFRIATPNEAQIRVSELENQIEIVQHSIDLKKEKLESLKAKLAEKRNKKEEEEEESTEEMPDYIKEAPNAKLTDKHVSSRNNEIVIYAGQYNFITRVVGKHSVPCKLTTELLDIKESCDTRLSSHHTNFKSTVHFIVVNDTKLREFIEMKNVTIGITAGKEELKPIGSVSFSLAPFLDDNLQITLDVPIMSPEDEKIGTIRIECACRKPIIL